MPVAFDATGTGAGGSASWTHTASGANRVVLVAAGFATASSYNLKSNTFAATYAGVAMTQVGIVFANNTNNNVVVLFALLNPPTTANAAVTISTSGTAARAVYGNSVSYTGVSAVSAVAPVYGAASTGSITVPSAPVDMAVGVFTVNKSSGVGTMTQTQRFNGGDSGTSTLLGVGLADAPGAASVSFGATFASSGNWGALGVDLVTAQNDWTGDATTTLNASASASGAVGSTGSATTPVTATATAAGTRGAQSGAATSVTVSATAAGVRGASSEAATTVFATANADGASGGSASTTATVASSADGSLIKRGGASTTTAVDSTAKGVLASSGVAATTVTATATSGGVAGRVSGASTTAVVTAVAGGVSGDIGGASLTVNVIATADGKAGGSAFTTVRVGTTADGHAHYADGHLDLTQMSDKEAFDRAEQMFVENYAAPAQLDVRLHDNSGYPLGQLGDYISTTNTFTRNKPGPGTITLKGDDPYGEVAMACKKTVVPVTIRTDHWKWTGRVTDCYDHLVDGVATYELQLIDDLAWASKIAVWPTWWSPIQFQPIKEAVYIGPGKSCILNMFSEQLLRLNYGLWEIVNNILNPSAYFATAYQLSKEQGNVPVVVMPTNMVKDTSKWTCMVARMEPADTVIESTLKDCGLRLKIWMWEPGEPQPAPGHYTLTVPTIVIDVVDETNVQGITGTALDGLIGQAVEFADTAFGSIIGALMGVDTSGIDDTDATNPYSGILTHWLGLDSIPPWVLYEDGPYSGIKESHVGAHHPLAYTVIGGGKSPAWVNQLIDLLLEALLSAILAYAGVSGISDTLLNGIFDDIILAFQLVEDAARRKALGKFGWPEYITQTGGAAWTLNELVALEAALWDTRGQYTFQFITRDGLPYLFGKDLDIGTPTSFIRRGTIYTDYLDQAVVTDDRNNYVDLLLTIGDANPQESPYAKFSRYLESTEAAIRAFTFQGG